jgi:hypothetical protein
MSSPAEHDGRLFEIIEDRNVGAYLYVYESGKCVCDFLQKDGETCKAFAMEEYSAPHSSMA